MTESRPEPELLTIAATARLLSVSIATVRRLVAAGELHAITLAPHTVRIARSEIDALIRRRLDQARGGREP